MFPLMPILISIAVTTIITTILVFIEELNADFAEGRTREANKKLDKHMLKEGARVKEIYKKHKHEMSDETKKAYIFKMKILGVKNVINSIKTLFYK